MSRSYKKNPGFNSSEKSTNKRYWIKIMNKRIRKSNMIITNGNSYRKFVERCNYRDYRWRAFTKNQIETSWYFEENMLYRIYIK